MLSKIFKSGLSVILALCLCLPFTAFAFAEEEQPDVKRVEIYSRISNDVLGAFGDSTKAYLPRGDDHDSQHLGLFLNAGESFRIRVNGDVPAAKGCIELRLLGNDHLIEESESAWYSLTNEWATVTAPFDCVPVIKTPVDNNLNTYSVEFETASTHEMPVYSKGKSNQEDFFSLWENTKACYAVIESDELMMIVPFADRNDICGTASNKFQTIEDMLDYFDNMLNQYEQFAGLENGAEADKWNVNPNTRYLIKADVNGYGLAYYNSENGVAMNNGSMAEFFAKDWVNTHELGHGYGTMLSYCDYSATLDVTEVWNNIYGYYYQIKTQPESEYWLKRTPEMLSYYENARLGGYYNCGYDSMLFFWINIFDIDPQGIMSTINRRYREAVYKNEQRTYKGENLYAQYISDACGYNVLPYFTDWGLEISDDLVREIAEKGYKNVTSLRFLTANDVQAQTIADRLDVKDIYSLVSSDDLKESGLSGKIAFSINAEDTEALEGREIQITDGEKLIATAAIENGSAEIELPIGVYTVRFPASAKNTYFPVKQDVFANVTAGKTNTVTAEYKKTDGGVLADYTILYRGLGDAEYFRAEYSALNQTIKIHRSNSAPHSYFDNDYSSFKITDADGNEIFSDVQLGNEGRGIDREINVDKGYIITPSHREASFVQRFCIYPTALTEQYREFASFEDMTPVQYRITEFGLEPISGTTYTDDSADVQTAYYGRLISYMGNLVKNNDDAVWGDSSKLIYEKMQICCAVSKLSDELKDRFMSSFRREFEQFAEREEEPQPTGLMGDVDENGTIDAVDASLVLQYYANIIDENTPNVNLKLADTDGSAAIDAADASLILQYYAGIISSFGTAA